MSGFLQRLVLRESGAGESIAPRLPSWFEPAGVPPGGELAAPAGPTPFLPDRPETMAAAPPIMPAQDAVQQAAQPAPQAAPLPGQVAQTRVSGVPRGSPLPLAPALKPPRQAPQKPALLAPPAAPLVERLAAAFVPTGRQALVAPLERASASPPGPEARGQTPTVADTVARAPARSQSDPSQASVLQARLSRMAPAVLAAARAADDARAAPAAPRVPDTVQVTIGRLEVRAVQGAKAAPQQPRSVQSPTSLDDYLARRNGEARR